MHNFILPLPHKCFCISGQRNLPSGVQGQFVKQLVLRQGKEGGQLELYYWFNPWLKSLPALCKPDLEQRSVTAASVLVGGHRG